MVDSGYFLANNETRKNEEKNYDKNITGTYVLYVQSTSNF